MTTPLGLSNRMDSPRLRRKIAVLAVLLTCIFVSNISSAGGPVPTINIGGTGYYGYESPEAACQAQLDLGLRTPTNNGVQVFLGLSVKSWLSTGGSGTWIDGSLPYNTPQLGGWMCFANYQYNFSWGTQYGSDQWIWMYPVCPATYTPGTYVIGSGADTCPSIAQYFVRVDVLERGCCLESPVKNTLISDPINPTNGNVYQSKVDIARASNASLIQFVRYYNSSNGFQGENNGNWRYAYSRSVTQNFNTSTYQLYDQSNPKYSSLYNDESSACTNGFLQIQSHVSNWTDAIASYEDGICSVRRSGIVVGTLQIYSAYKELPPPQPTPVAYDVVRDDGELIRFVVSNGSILGPPSITLKLQQTSTGFTITDANDNVEQYDANGKLLAVTSRGGVVQTMNYDSANRLSSVVDSFGHQLILNYDAQGHLSAVTRQ